MNDQENYEDLRAKELDDERVILENQYQFLKREETRLEKAYEELKTSRLAKLKLRYSELTLTVINMKTENQAESYLYKGRHMKHEGNVV